MQKQVITPNGQPFFFLDAAGDDFEIGRQIGEATAGDIHAMWDSYAAERMVEWFGTPSDVEAKTAEWLRKNLGAICPWMCEQIDGIAAGSGMDADRVWLLNHYSMLWSASGLFCSSMSLRNSDVGPVLLQNLDIGSDDFYYVTRIHPTKGNATLSDAMCTMAWSPTGVNSVGLAIGSSNLAAVDRKPAKPLPNGIINTLMPRMVLRECSTTGEAVEFLRSLPQVIPDTSGYQMNIIDAAGEMAVVDKTGTEFEVRQCRQDMNFTTNYSPDERVEKYRVGDASPEKSYCAYMRGRNILDLYASLGGRPPTVEWAKELFHGHNGDGRLCRHGDEASCGGYSRLHFVYYPRELRAEITNGLPCQNEYQNFSL